MLIDAVVFGALGFLIGWLIRTFLLSSKGGLGTGGAIGLCAVVWVVAVLVLATWLQGKSDYLMESLLDKAIAQQHQRDPSWVPPERQPIRHGSSSPKAGNAASLLAIGLFWGVKRRKQNTEDKLDSNENENRGSLQINSSQHIQLSKADDQLSLNHHLPSIEERFFEAASVEIKTCRFSQGLMAKAISDSDGDEKKANARYMKLRVDQMIKDSELVVIPEVLTWQKDKELLIIPFIVLILMFIVLLLWGSASWLESTLGWIGLVCGGFLVYGCASLVIPHIMRSPTLIISGDRVHIRTLRRHCFRLAEIESIEIERRMTDDGKALEVLIIALKNKNTVRFGGMFCSIPLEQLRREVQNRLSLIR